MLDIGWSEMLMIAVVAIVVIGPKDLPRTLRTIGKWIGKARAVTRDLQNSVNDMIADSEIDELRKAGNSIGDFGGSELLNMTDDADGPLDASQSRNDDYPTPPPTPMKWPPDGDFDASDEELAEITPDIIRDDGIDTVIDEAEDRAPVKSTDT